MKRQGRIFKALLGAILLVVFALAGNAEAVGTWSLTGSMSTPRWLHTATLLPNGRVLASGGYSGGYLASAELYDPALGTWSPTGSMSTPRYTHTATLLPNGRVLASAGECCGGVLASAELYDSAAGTWSLTGSMSTPRSLYTATLLADGQVLVNGGSRISIVLASAELYDPVLGTWSLTASMSASRFFHTTTLLPDGRGLISGGHSGSAALASAEVLTQNEPPTAEAGANQSIHVGQNVELNGGGSSDDNTPSENLLYAWSFSSAPAGSTAVLTGADTVTPSFIADMPGDYVISLVVTDEGALSSAPDEVTVSSLNTPPTANAGPDQGSYVGNTVVLDGSASSDADFDPLTYAWTLSSRPAGSHATLSGADSAMPTFLPDLAGTYVSQLVVNDGHVDSTPDEVNTAVITTEQFAEGQAMEALNVVSSLPPASVTTKGNQTALGNLLLQAIESLQASDPSRAIRKLEAAVERTDGCALRGSPDAGGGGGGDPPAKDYVANCTDQAVIYPGLMDALDALSP